MWGIVWCNDARCDERSRTRRAGHVVVGAAGDESEGLSDGAQK